MKETRARELIVKRSVGMCERCGGNGAEYSHRRSRGVRDPHAWCPCNGVRLCRTCHAWAHRHPRAARREGIHVSRYVAEPASVPVRFVNGWWYLSCDGGAQYLGARTLDFGTDRE